jgi:large subunit ribosomal protein L10
MAKTKQQKSEILDKLTDAFKSSASTVFVHFKGVTVGNETKIRRALEEEDVNYFVAKKTLMRIAAEKAQVDGEVPELNGEVAIAYGKEDPTSPARNIHAFVKELGEESFSIIGGIYEGKLVDAQKMQEIATIPPLDVLRGMFANVINSPIQGLAVALGQVAESKS